MPLKFIFFTAAETQRIMAIGMIEHPGPDLAALLIGGGNFSQLRVKNKPDRSHFLGVIKSHI
jgi:hypothetical protein